MRFAQDGETGCGDGGIEFRQHVQPKAIGEVAIIAYAGTESAADAAQPPSPINEFMANLPA